MNFILHSIIFFDKFLYSHNFSIELSLFLVTLINEGRKFFLNFVTFFIGNIGNLNDFGHGLPLFDELCLHSFVNSLKNDFFLSEVIDFNSENFILRNRLIKLLIGLIKSVLQNFDLLLELFILGKRGAGPNTLRVSLLLNYLFLD